MNARLRRAGNSDVIRIRGIVSIAQRVRHRLKTGIPADEVANFKQFVASTVETVERLCAEGRTTPDQLPAQSRKAYHFLKHLDLDDLPVCEDRGPAHPEKTVRLRNITAHQRAILQTISKLARTATPDDAERRTLLNTLAQSVAAIERICAEHDISPANLAGPSRQTYAWMKFLTDERNFQLHLQATRRALRIADNLVGSQHQRPRRVAVQFINMAGLYKGRSHRQAAVVQITEGFINASDDVLQAVVASALLGKHQNLTRAIRDYASSEEFSDVLIELDLMAETIAEKSDGKCYDLEEIFDAVNRQYFAGRLARPRLTWGRTFTVRKFAHYEPARDRVVVSLTLDDDRIPRFVVEFVLYHELLHKHHGEKWVGGRLVAHTPEFRRDERKFQMYHEAQRWIKKLAAS